MNNAVRSTMVGAGVGAGLMLLLDPARGARRRALVRDKITYAARKTRDAYGATRRDLGNRLSGLKARTRWGPGQAVSDRKLEGRVRSVLGRVSSHPGAIRVSASHSSVMLAGDVLASDARRVEAAVRAIRGVVDVRNELVVHPAGTNVPALQGRSNRPGWWSSWTAGTWSPTAKLLAGIGAAASLAAVAASRRA